jgi:hypothetical protein
MQQTQDGPQPGLVRGFSRPQRIQQRLQGQCLAEFVRSRPDERGLADTRLAFD